MWTLIQYLRHKKIMNFWVYNIDYILTVSAGVYIVGKSLNMW